MFNKADIEKYFAAEKSESLLFVVIGVAAIVAGIVFFFFIKTSFYKGAAVPLLLVGLLLGVVGFSVYKRSDADRLKNVYAYDMNPGQLREKEIPRMETVMKNFVVYRYAEVILAVLGIGLFVYFNNNNNQSFWKGLGAGMVLMALIALSADYFAEKRGQVYLNGLKGWVEKMK